MAMQGLGAGSRSRVMLSEINITPMVDVMLVLLIMFMVTAPLMQQGIEVELPETAASGVEATDEPFLLVIDRDGGLSAGGESLTMQGLAAKISAIFETRDNRQLYIQADRHVDYGVVAEAMAEVRAAGIFNIGLLTLPKSGQ